MSPNAEAFPLGLVQFFSSPISGIFFGEIIQWFFEGCQDRENRPKMGGGIIRGGEDRGAAVVVTGEMVMGGGLRPPL